MMSAEITETLAPGNKCKINPAAIAICALLASTGASGNINHNGDCDGDGLMDPTVYCEATGEWRALLVSTDYEPVSIYWGGPGWTAIQSDYDGDGKGDYAVTWPDTSEWRMWRSSRGYGSDHCVDDWHATGFRPVQR